MQSTSQNDIALDIEDGKKTGRYKDCLYLKNKKEFHTYDTYFKTFCDQNSLELQDGDPKYGTTSCPPVCSFL